MTKIFAILPALALVVALSGSALAENGAVGSNALQAMGLGGIEVMSDDAAMEVRGKGWHGMYMPAPPAGADKPWSLAYGASYANVGNEGTGAGTIDGFVAEGKFMAAGEHFSEAGKTTTESYLLEVKGLPATLEVNTYTIRVFAGGFASSSSL